MICNLPFEESSAIPTKFCENLGEKNRVLQKFTNCFFFFSANFYKSRNLTERLQNNGKVCNF